MEDSAPARERARLAKLGEYQLLDSAPEPEFDAIARDAAAQADAPAATITLVDGHRQWFKARVGVDASETPLDASICAVALRSGEGLFVVPDARRDPRFSDMPGVKDGMGIRFYGGAPLRAGDGTGLGMLCVIDVEPRAGLTEDEQRTLLSLARRTVAAFELRRAIAAGDGLAPGATGALAHASELLVRASVALEKAGAGEAAAYLDHVIAMVDATLDTKEALAA